MKKVVIALSLSLIVGVGVSRDALGQAPSLEGIQEKMQELDWLVGKWKEEGKTLPDGNEANYEWDCDWMLDKSFIECHFTDPSQGNEVYKSEILGYNPHQAYFYANIYGAGAPGWSWTQTLVKNGEKWIFQGEANIPEITFIDRIVFAPNDGYWDIDYYRSINGGEFSKYHESKATKVD